MRQIIVTEKFREAIREIETKRELKRMMLVCDRSFWELPTCREYDSQEVIACTFNGFSSNPKKEEILRGVERFLGRGCDSLLAVGGGSCIDTAKCIRHFSKKQVPLIAVPTTAGTGSESTMFAVCYVHDEKQSISGDDMLPDYAFLDARNLRTLPLYQKKCTVADALCQAVESCWSVRRTEESRVLAEAAIRDILAFAYGYFHGDDQCAEAMMQAANRSGRAICISQTTAAHAMSYKMTSLYRLPHGRAAFVSLPYVWEYMV